MNELQEELKFLIKEIGLYEDWENFFMGLINIRDRESLRIFDSSDSPNCDIEGTLNKLKSLLGQHEPFKTNSEEETETNFTESVSKSFNEELESSYGGCSLCETWEEGSNMTLKFSDSLPLVVISSESSFCSKHQVDPITLDPILKDIIFYVKKCTRETVTGIYTLSDIFEIPEEKSDIFKELVTSLWSSLNNLHSYDTNTLEDIMENIIKIISLSPKHERRYSSPTFCKDTLKIGRIIANIASELKARDILDLVLEIDSEISDLPVSAEVEMVLSLIPALFPIWKYVHTVHFFYPIRSYSFIIHRLNALEIIYRTYRKHLTSITSMKQEDISLEYEKIAESISLLRTIDENMCSRLNSGSDYD